ncbi:unnamed protein product [marine sediment metagenome]|uniref:Uncharacterized protein n=1 Tax=marine sediment metagenome TaxID=412755 RepID=X0SJ14_9ZZZZ
MEELKKYLSELEHNLSCVNDQSEGRVRFNMLEIQSWINDMNKIILQTHKEQS